MTDLDIAAPLAAALNDKGYQTLTPVQLAVLAPEVRGRDALVSAQTGSGKTVAFGLMMATEVLSGTETLPPAASPLALVIAPTRELALQVARELSWLYGPAQAQIATCVGGMDYRTERRNLDRGAHIVVGTPGRLRDHIERGNLDLSALRVLVLDEADEMLDLGFREDLEFILSKAPEQRRTLMFSATVSPEIAALAQTYQRDALRLQMADEARQHVDITYQAICVAPRDREHAIFNLLRFHEARCAMVFCKTRVNVNHLFARMSNRGFKVVALSGELSQQERTHALMALRDGRARVCIATDVAARGIDLPGLELVIHADLPSNRETLLHRSGRTGRAGAKGVSALIVPSPEINKVQRLLSAAQVVAEWRQAPSAEAVQARDEARLMAHPALMQPVGEEAAIAEKLLERFGAAQIAAAFVRNWREGCSPPEELIEVTLPSRSAPAPRAKRRLESSVWFVVNRGHAQRAEARWLLPKICEAGGLSREAIGVIKIRTQESFVQMTAEAAAVFGDIAEIEPTLFLERLEGDPTAPDAPRRPHPSRHAERHASRHADHHAPAHPPRPHRLPDTRPEMVAGRLDSEAAPHHPPRSRKAHRKGKAAPAARLAAAPADAPHAPAKANPQWARRWGASRTAGPRDDTDRHRAQKPEANAQKLAGPRGKSGFGPGALGKSNRKTPRD